MKQIVTTGIILNRTNYGEADRIITLLTPDQGKLRLIAKGVRKVKSKLAGGIELFSVSHVTYIQGRKDIGTLISARLARHYGGIVKSLDRTMLGYELIKQLDRATEDEPEAEYFELLEQAFEALDAPLKAVGSAGETTGEISGSGTTEAPGDASAAPVVGVADLDLIRLWFSVQLLRLGGHTPNLEMDATGKKLQSGVSYSFSFDDMAFVAAGGLPGGGTQSTGGVSVGGRGSFTPNHIKFLRLAFAGYRPAVLVQVRDVGRLVAALMPLVQTVLQMYVR